MIRLLLYLKLVVYTLIFFYSNLQYAFCQNCINYTDTLKCYRSSKFEKKPIKIGTKTVPADTIDFYDFPLVTDWNGDCMPEVIISNYNYYLKLFNLKSNILLNEFPIPQNQNYFLYLKIILIGLKIK